MCRFRRCRACDRRREKPEDKLGILDLELDINDREKVDIEIQLVDKSNIQERLLFYFSKLYYNEVKKGDDYKKAKRVVMVAILDYDFNLTKEIKRMETKWKLREENAKDLFKFRDFLRFSQKTLMVSRFLVYFYIKNLFFIFQPSLNKPIMNRLFVLCNYFLEQRKLAIIWRRFLYILPFFYSNLGIF